MEAIALTRASELIHAADTLERLGESPERVCRQANLPMWHYCDPDDLIPDHQIRQFLDRAGRSLGTKNFGLMVGEHTCLSSMGSFGRLIASAFTVHHALSTTSNLIRLQTTGGSYSLAEAGEEIWFCGSQFRGPDIGRREREQYALLRMIDHVRIGVGPSWLPAKICLQAREAPNREFRLALGDPDIRIGRNTTAFAIPRVLLPQQPQRSATAPGNSAQTVQERLWHMAPAADLAGSLRQVAGTLLKIEGPPRIETMAEIAGLSTRSLQRRLAEHGLSHFEIVDQARYQAAIRLLEDRENRITDIAMDLGYTDSAHFTRAFKRWAGVTPREYRRFPPLPQYAGNPTVH